MGSPEAERLPAKSGLRLETAKPGCMEVRRKATGEAMPGGDRWGQVAAPPSWGGAGRGAAGSGGPLPGVLLPGLAGDPGRDGHGVPLPPPTRLRCHPVPRG